MREGIWIRTTALILILSRLGQGQRSSNESELTANEEEYYDDAEHDDLVDDLELQRRQSLQRPSPQQSMQMPPQFYNALLNPNNNPNMQISPPRLNNVNNLFNMGAQSGRPGWVQPMGNGMPVNPNLAPNQRYVVLPGGGDMRNLPGGQLVNGPRPGGPQTQPVQQPRPIQPPPSAPRMPDPNIVGRPKEPVPWNPQQPFGAYPASGGQRLVVMPNNGGQAAGRGPPPMPSFQNQPPPRPPQQPYFPQQPPLIMPTAQGERPPFYPQGHMVSPQQAIRLPAPQRPAPAAPAPAPAPAPIPAPAPMQPQMHIVRTQSISSQSSIPNLTGQHPALPPVAQSMGKPAPAPHPNVDPSSKLDSSQGSGKPIGIHTPHGKLLLEPYFENYCDQRQYSDDLLSSKQMQRVEYFVANLTCSRYFFECAVGQTFLLNCTSQDQVFDINTVNCNFKYNVRTCSEYDNILHCTIKEECQADQFACCAPPQQCISYLKRCDGVVDCADGDDENNCPSCDTNEFPCVKSGKCIAWEKRCNGIPDECFDQTNLDEQNCGGCPADKFACIRPSDSYAYSPVCIESNLRCNGIRDCPKGEDELNCKSKGQKYLLCENQKQSVSKDQWCDGYEDCLDGSDEKYCIY